MSNALSPLLYFLTKDRKITLYVYSSQKKVYSRIHSKEATKHTHIPLVLHIFKLLLFKIYPSRIQVRNLSIFSHHEKFKKQKCIVILSCVHKNRPKQTRNTWIYHVCVSMVQALLLLRNDNISTVKVLC